ncbi:sensor histidine kinase [Aliikangiella sp. G2MR2-5]|uniref:sensor histidine kinase n=1 Tax=Aliikangiella sp. G2MR2-5 TaxID=2788943 RepID=UPI0018A92399|nr:ATP-binding protein [Aliikangiella sp. G2MR2-5]
MEANTINSLKAQLSDLRQENLTLQRELAVKNVISEISQFQGREDKLENIYKRIFTLLTEIIHIENFYICLKVDGLLDIPFIIDESSEFTKEQLNESTNPDLKHSLVAYALKQKRSLILAKEDVLELVQNEKVKCLGNVPCQWVFLPFHAVNLHGGIVAQQYDREGRFSYSDMSMLAYVTMHVGNFLSAYHSKAKIKQQYEELKSAQSQLVHSEKMASIGQLAAGVAHEINNPLGYVNSNLNTLKDYVMELGQFIDELLNQVGDICNKQESCSQIPEVISNLKNEYEVEFILSDTQELVSESIFGMEKVKKIIQSLKNFTHAGEEQMKKSDINACIEETVRIVWNELKYHCKVKKELGELPETYCHPSQLNQVFMNLLINAGHAIKEKGEISIKTYKVDDFICIKIQDNGTGIDEKHLNQLFNPFFTTKPVGQGTGLGLSISYGIIENHKGKIVVESEVGVGTCFTIHLPIVSSLEEAEEEADLNSGD